MKDTTKRLSAAFAATALLMMPSAVSADSTSYSDVKPGNTHYKGISNITEKGFVKGYPDGNYHTWDHVKRGQMAAILTKAADLDVPGNKNQVLKRYSDVHPGSDYADQIAAVTNASIFKGYPNGTFGTWSDMTRQQMASVLVTAFDLNTIKTNVSKGDFDRESIQTIANLGITNEIDDYRPNEYVNRGQVATFITKSMNIANDASEDKDDTAEGTGDSEDNENDGNESGSDEDGDKSDNNEADNENNNENNDESNNEDDDGSNDDTGVNNDGDNSSNNESSEDNDDNSHNNDSNNNSNEDNEDNKDEPDNSNDETGKPDNPGESEDSNNNESGSENNQEDQDSTESDKPAEPDNGSDQNNNENSNENNNEGDKDNDNNADNGESDDPVTSPDVPAEPDEPNNDDGSNAGDKTDHETDGDQSNNAEDAAKGGISKPSDVPQINVDDQSRKYMDNMYDAINQKRKEAGKRPLKRDPELENIAMVRAKDMAEYGFVDHTTQTYGGLQELSDNWTKWSEDDKKVLYLAENAVQSNYDVSKDMEMYMDSAPHKRSILQDVARTTGIGVYTYKGFTVNVQMFKHANKY